MNDLPAEPALPSAPVSFREMATEAIRYWEPRRLVYNGVMGLIVIGHFAAGWPASGLAVTLDGALFLFLLAVLANICYCAAYIVDLFAQYSDFRTRWLQWRGWLFLLGLIFAGILTHFFAFVACSPYSFD